MKWVGGDITKPDVWSVFWGDGIIIKNEQWDDGNLIDEDGWDSSWNIEKGYSCSRNAGNLYDVCIEIWGDGINCVKTNNNWDDGNNVDGDGCTKNWSVEPGYIWIGGSKATKDNWYTVCGDGILTTISEEWDDGNTKSDDGCSSDWKIEKNWYCDYNGLLKPQNKCTEYWGDR